MFNNANITVDISAATVTNTPPTNSTKVTAQTAFNLIESLVTSREQWQETAYQTSNDLLYGLLQRCYGLYFTMCDRADGKAAWEGFNLYLSNKGLSFKKGTHTITQIVRCVFGDDRRRVSAYSIVLRRALADNITPINLPQFIRSAGGVEEVRLAKSPTALSPKQRSEIAATRLDNQTLATVKAEPLTKCLDLAKTGQCLVLIATQQADGEVTINAVVNSDSVITAALASYYSTNKKAWSNAEAAAATQSQQNKLSDSIDAAVQSQIAA